MHTQTHSYFLKAHHLIFWSKFSFSDSDNSANFWEFFLFVLTGHLTGWQAGDIVCTVKCMLGTHMHIIPRRRQRLQYFLSSFPPLLLYLNPCQRPFSSLFSTCYIFSVLFPTTGNLYAGPNGYPIPLLIFCHEEEWKEIMISADKSIAQFFANVIMV